MTAADTRVVFLTGFRREVGWNALEVVAKGH